MRSVIAMDKTSLISIAALVLLCGGCAQPRRHAGIEHFVEVRGGRESVWGVNIHLDRLSFRPQVKPNEIKIVDGKRGRDLKPLMTWSVSRDRKTLGIRFKPGMGDFGTGNAVTVHIEKSALEGYSGVNNRFEWSMLTDVQ